MNQSRNTTSNGKKWKCAGFDQLDSGSMGPRFDFSNLETHAHDSVNKFPRWKKRLEPSQSGRLAEGGLRLLGKFKNNNPELPLVSYVTVVRNNAKLLRRAIESVQKQYHANVEHIVLDGASTDGSLEVIKSCENTLDYYVSEPDGGLYEAINKAVPLARGQYICILNSDDWLSPDAAGIAVRNLKDKPQNALLLTSARVHSGNGVESTWDPEFVHPGSYLTCADVCHNGIYTTRNAYMNAGLYDSSYNIAGDFKWIMKCLDIGVSFVYSNEITIHYSLGGISHDRKAHSHDCMRVVRDRFPYLSETDIQNLHWCFFSFIHESGPLLGFKAPSNYMEYLKSLFCRFADSSDFLRAVSWASITKLQHPFDTRMKILLRIFHAFRNLISVSPHLHMLAKRIYEHLR